MFDLSWFSSVTVHTLFDVYTLVPDVHCNSQIHTIGPRYPCAKEFFSPQQIVRVAWTVVRAGEEPTVCSRGTGLGFFSGLSVFCSFFCRLRKKSRHRWPFSRLSVHRHASLAPDDNHVAGCQEGRFGCGRAACSPFPSVAFLVHAFHDSMEE
jgi:hypothetical protein